MRYTPRACRWFPLEARPRSSVIRAFVYSSAVLIGDVVLEEGANVWPGAVLRGDVERISLGAYTSFQDNAVAHTDPGFPLRSGPTASSATASSSTAPPWGARCLIGMGAILLNGCEIGDECIVGAGALVTQGKVFAPRSLIVGSPAKAVREVTDDTLCRAPSCAIATRGVRWPTSKRGSASSPSSDGSVPVSPAPTQAGHAQPGWGMMPA